MTGTPVREWRRGGIIESDWDVGVRTRRRRGLAMCLVCELRLEGFAGRLAEAVGVMVRWLRVVAGIRGYSGSNGSLLVITLCGRRSRRTVMEVRVGFCWTRVRSPRREKKLRRCEISGR